METFSFLIYILFAITVGLKLSRLIKRKLLKKFPGGGLELPLIVLTLTLQITLLFLITLITYLTNDQLWPAVILIIAAIIYYSFLVIKGKRNNQKGVMDSQLPKPINLPSKHIARWIFLVFLGTVSSSLLAGWFYWFQWRPKIIRKNCYEIIQNDPTDKRFISQKTQNNTYRSCLAKHGLKPESLFVNLE